MIFKFRFVAIMLLGLVTLSAPASSYAQFSKKQEKELTKQRDKMYKEKVKELKKDGWKIHGGSRTLEVALLEHYQKLAEGTYTEWFAEVSRCRSINAGRNKAIVNAQTSYVNEISAEIEGVAASVVALDEGISGSEADLFASEFKKCMKVNMSGLLKESYALVKDDGRFKQYRIVYLIDEEQAGLVQKRALEATYENSQIPRDLIKKIIEDIDNAKPE